jgi:hypothetical protein
MYWLIWCRFHYDRSYRVQCGISLCNSPPASGYVRHKAPDHHRYVGRILGATANDVVGEVLWGSSQRSLALLNIARW